METYQIQSNEFKNISKSFYQHTAWFEIVKNGLNVDYKIFETKDTDKIVCQTVVFIMKKGFVKFIGSPLRGTFTPHLGPVWHGKFEDQYKLQVLDSIITEIKKLKPAYLELGLNNNLLKNHDLTASWTTKTMETFIVTLDENPDIVWKKLDKRGRNMTRKAEKSGVIIEELDYSLENVNKFYNLLVETFKRRGCKIHHPKSFFIELVRELSREKMILFLETKVKGETASMGIFVYNDFEIHFLSGASNPNFNCYAPNNLMHWFAIKKASEMKIQKYDMGGKGIASIDRFKASFGGETHSFTKKIWMSNLIKFPVKLLSK
jgi:lipid II:glycine glycyltransferase (peptidoglycan interpeptide bridge formation enzyme)